MNKSVNSLSALSLPLVTDDYHLIVSSEEFDQYQQKSRKKRWFIFVFSLVSIVIIASVSLFVMPLFLKAHLGDQSTHEEQSVQTDHSIDSSHQKSSNLSIDDISRHTFMPAVYGE